MAIVHPPVMAPRLPAPSSTTYRFQVPLGLVPLKADSSAPPGAAGAGAGQTSSAPSTSRSKGL